MKRAFTLAEVLITLTIIGVIAALTIPNLMQKWADHADVQKVKQAYSILNNAFKMMIAENGNLDEWNFPENKSYSANNSEYLGNMLAKYLKVQKYCGKNDGCFSKNILRVDGIKGGALYNGEQGGRMILSNGMSVMIWSGSVTSFSNNRIMIDINGLKKPNRVGYDIFYLGFSQNGLDWRGHAWLTTKAYCNPTVNTNTGESCTYWVITHGNMDYKYRDVSAEW